MTAADGALERLWIVGAGSVALAFASRLNDSPAIGAIHLSGRQDNPPDHPIFTGASRVTYSVGLTPPDTDPTAVLVAVPDRAIAGVAATLAGFDLQPIPVLHHSGALGREVLEPLRAAGWSTGSLHPLAAIPRGDTGAAGLQGAWFALEANGTARTLAEQIVASVDGRIIDIDEGGKPLYHAAAVFASNYVVTLLATAERLFREAGADEADTRAALAALAAGALNNVKAHGPGVALTGPIARGDVDTVRLHLDRLSHRDAALYSCLARATLELAGPGLDAEALKHLHSLLGDAG